MKIGLLTILAFGLLLTANAWASGGCSSCAEEVEVKFYIEESIDGSFYVTLNGEQSSGSGTDTTAITRSTLQSVKLEVDKEYEVAVNVGSDSDEDKDEAKVYFECNDECGLVFEVYSAYYDTWTEIKEATVYKSGTSTSQWDFNSEPVDGIKVRLRKQSCSSQSSSGSCSSSGSSAGSAQTSMSGPSLTQPGSDFPTSSSDQPDGIKDPGMKHTIHMGEAPRYQGEEKLAVSAGHFRLSGSVGSPALANRANLAYNALPEADVTVMNSSTGELHQVETGQVLAIAADESTGFSVKLYGEGKYQFNGTTDLYEPTIASDPFAIYHYKPITSGIRIEETINGFTTTREIIAPAAGGTSWRETILDASGAAIQVTESNSGYYPTAQNTKWQRVEVITVHRDGVLYSRVEKEWEQMSWGEELAREREYYGNSSHEFEETTYQYFDAQEFPYHGKTQSVSEPGGKWVEYEYRTWDGYLDGKIPGQLKFRHEPWLNSSSVPVTTGNRRFTEYFYGPDPKSHHMASFSLLNKTIVSVADTTSAATIRKTEVEHDLTFTETKTSVDAASSPLLKRVDEFGTGDWAGMPDKVTDHDNTVTDYGYQKGTYDEAPGTFTPDIEGDFTEITQYKGVDNPGSVSYLPNQSTGTLTIRDPKGRNVREIMLVRTGSAWEQASVSTWTYIDTNADGVDEKIIHTKDGVDVSTVQQVTGRESHEWDRAGWQTITKTDELGRLTSVRRVGQNGQADVLTSYDHTGRHVVVTVTAGSYTTTSSMTRDLMGRLIESVDEDGLVTSHDYGFAASGGRLHTVTRPDGMTEITEYYYDGQIKSITGTGVVHRFYDYSVDATTGFVTTTEYVGSAASPRYTNTTSDWAGRVIEESKPAFTGTWTRGHGYNDLGQHTHTTTTGLATTRYQYDSLGQRVRQGADVDGQVGLDEASTDSISETITDYVLDNGAWMHRTTTYQWLTDDSSVKTMVSSTKTMLNTADGYSETEDVHGDLTTVTAVVNSGVLTTTTDVPYANTDQAVISAGGRTLSMSDPQSGNVQTYGYDDLGRVTTITGSRGDVTTITYYPGSYRRHLVTPPVGPATEYLYVPNGQPGAGQVQSVITKDRNGGTVLSTVSYTYDARGNRVTEEGSGTYPKEYVYHPDYPEMTTMKTWRDAGGTADLTTWVYQPSTGLLTRKQYADGNGTDYTYYASGLLHTREWERNGTTGQPLTTTYTYDLRGQRDTVTYSDAATPPIDHDYNRAGRLAQVTDAAGVRTYGHAADGQIGTETFTSGLFSGYTVTHGFGSVGHGLRDSLSVTDATGTIVSNGYGYESDTGRLVSAYSAEYSATYEYLPNTSWQSLIAHSFGAATPWIQRTHRDLGDRVTGVVGRSGTSASGAILASAGYKLDNRGRRQWLTREDGSRWEYAYNDRNEVTGGKKRNASGSLFAGRQFEYDYDDIGNRDSAKFGGDATGGNLHTIDYNANAVNQYDSISHPGIMQVLGYSPDTGTITATPNPLGSTTVQGDHWRAEIQADNTTTGKWTTVDIEQDQSGNPVSIGSGGLWVPEATFAPVHDADGNLTDDGRWISTWNGENRLVGMVTTPEAIAGGHPWMRLTFTYDYLGRRITKKVETGNATTPVVAQDRLFLYDGWNMVAEIEKQSGTSKTHATYLWGPDISGRGQGAGGVGGLLLCRLDSNGDGTPEASYCPAYDGNGNIVAWVDHTGAVAQRLDHDPFGRVITQLGGIPGLHYGFSTKYTDLETGLYYYGYRYYDPQTGRWPSRDPIGERGGVNLYGFNLNNPIDRFDDLGHKSQTQREAQRQARNQANQTGRANNQNAAKTTRVNNGILNNSGNSQATALVDAAQLLLDWGQKKLLKNYYVELYNASYDRAEHTFTKGVGARGVYCNVCVAGVLLVTENSYTEGYDYKLFLGPCEDNQSERSQWINGDHSWKGRAGAVATVSGVANYLVEYEFPFKKINFQ